MHEADETNHVETKIKVLKLKKFVVVRSTKELEYFIWDRE